MVQQSNPRILTPDNARSFAGLRIVSASQVVNDGWCLALYSSGGAGKTTTASMITKSKHGGKALIADAEAGASSVAHLGDTVDVAPITSWGQLVDLRKAVGRAKSKEDLAHWTYVIDNMTEIQAMRIQEIASGGDVQIQHYGKCMADILRETRSWRDLTRSLGINVIFIMWEDRDKDPENERWTRRVYFTNKLQQAFPGVVTSVGHITMVRGKPDYRMLSFVAGNDVDSKFRVAPTEFAAKIPQELYYRADMPVLADMLDAMHGDTMFPAEKYAKPKPNAAQQSS